MRLAAFGVFAALLLISRTSSAQDKDAKDAKELILGKWTSVVKVGDVDEKLFVEFTKENVFKTSGGAFKLEGKYKWLDKDYIEVAFQDSEGKDLTQKTKVSVTATRLELYGRDNKVVTFERLK